METKVIIGVDVGTNGGYAVLVNGEFEESGTYKFNSLVCTNNFFKDLVEKWKPDAIITGKPNGFKYNLIARHYQFYGVFGVTCELKNIPLVLENDSTMRAFVLGKGNGKRKDLVHEKYKGETPDVSDAMMFADYLWLKQNET